MDYLGGECRSVGHLDTAVGQLVFREGTGSEAIQLGHQVEIRLAHRVEIRLGHLVGCRSGHLVGSQ